MEAGEEGQRETLLPDEVNWGNEDELEGLCLWVCSMAFILPGQQAE